jgi:hypothetical protein
MIDRDEQPTLFGIPPMGTGQVVVVGAPTAREVPDRARQERAAFVRKQVEQVIKKRKTAAAYRSKAKKLLEKAEAVGDTAAGDEARALYLLAERAETRAETFILALIARTELR